MPWTVVANPAAGRGRTRRLLPELAAALRDVAPDAELVVSPEPDAPERLARAAAEAGHDLVAAGGDGVVGVVAGVAAETGRRFSIVPSGAGNDFARVLGFDPKRPLDALLLLADGGGDDHLVDLGRVNGRWYTCVTATGFDAEANRWANTVERISGTALYVAAVLRTLAVWHPLPFRVVVDGESHDVEAWLVSVANGPSYGGGMRIAPRASLSDGMLDVTVVGPITKPDLLRTFPRVFKGTHVSHPKVWTLRGASVQVHPLDGRALDVYADGERVGPLPAMVEAVPGALQVRTPKGVTLP